MLKGKAETANSNNSSLSFTYLRNRFFAGLVRNFSKRITTRKANWINVRLGNILTNKDKKSTI